MATATTSCDSEFLFRLQTLLIDGGTGVLRNTFDQRLQNQPLNVFLKKNKTTIEILQRQKKITIAQIRQLYPSKSQHQRSADFDITLIVCLLRNLPSLGLRQNFSWDTQPQSTDTSTEADLCRLKELRNKVAHISSTQEFNQTTFLSHWNDIEQVLLRLNGALTNPDPILKQTIEDYKNRPLDKAAEKRLRLMIEKWREMDKDLGEKVEQMHSSVRDVFTNVTHLRRDVKEVKEVVSEIYNRKEKQTTEETTLSNFQENLIRFYKRRHSSICLSPLLEVDTPLLALYQMPTFSSVQVQWALGGGKEVKTPVEKFSDIFYKDNRDYGEIYLIGEAGLGKTSFCRRLVLTWCQAKTRTAEQEKYFSRDELDTINRFDAVFLLTLRDSIRECDIDKMIYNQIVRNLDINYSLAHLENILTNTKCLVILDGLDEWSHPSVLCTQGVSDIPHRRVRKWTVLTTTRPWMLSGSNVKNSEIDQKLELSSFSRKDANMLKKAMISHILQEGDEEILNKHIEKFNDDLRKHRISSLERNPLILMYLLCLWCDKRKLGESLSELYSNIIELLLSKTVDKYKKRGKDLPVTTSSTDIEIPNCFIGHKVCKMYYTLLENLSEIAFNHLTNESMEENLVFGGKELKNHELLKFCLESGILTQSTIRGKLTERETKMSFAHTTVQEFFAALHMHTNPDKVTVERRIISRCKCVQDILEMSKVFVFVCGINVNVASSISRELINVVNKDKITNKYRKKTQIYDSATYTQSLKELQKMCISCLKENPNNNNLKVYLQDILFDKECMKEENYKQLQQLAVQNIKNIKSVSIEMNSSVQNIVGDLKNADLSRVNKIHYKGPFCKTITPLLHRSVQCLSVISGKWKRGTFVAETSSWTPEFITSVCGLDNLQAICINKSEMSHDDLATLVKYVSTMYFMREILLLSVLCTDHSSSCTGSLLDLSKHGHLKRLELYNIPLSALKINVASLKECRVGQLHTPGNTTGLASDYLRYLHSASKLHTLICHGLNRSVDTMLDTLRLLSQIRTVWLFYIHLKNRKLPFSEMKNLNLVGLSCVEMTASTFCDLVSSVQELPQTVTVYTLDCTVTPEEDFEKEKDRIKTSPHFCLIVGLVHNIKDEFMFHTIKDRDRLDIDQF